MILWLKNRFVPHMKPDLTVQEKTTRQNFNVMQIISNLEIGGGQEVVRTLALNLNELGARTIVCTFADGPLRKEIEIDGIPVFILPGRTVSILSFLRFLGEMKSIRDTLWELIDKYQVEVVQTHLLRVLNLPVMAVLRFNPSLMIFWTFHNERFSLREDHLHNGKWLLKPKRWAYKLLYLKAADRISGYIAVSEQVKKALNEEIGSISDKVTVIINGVDLRRYHSKSNKQRIRKGLGLSREEKVISVIATFKAQKGQRYLIDAATTLVNDFPDLKILFVGDGELRGELEAKSKALNLDNNIEFLGTRQDIPEILAASDMFVLPSLWEGLPMALIEAMASGLPIVATDVSGSKQAVISGETGILVPPGDARELGDAIKYLLSNPDIGERMGAAARLRADEVFSATKQAQDHLDLYRRSCNING